MISPATDSAVQQLVDALKQASPVVWQAAYKQVLIDSSFEAVGAFVFLLITVGLIIAAFRSDDDGVGFGIGSLLSLTFFILALYSSVSGFLNANYAAIGQLTDLIKK
jgi:hypothetical protein